MSEKCTCDEREAKEEVAEDGAEDGAEEEAEARDDREVDGKSWWRDGRGGGGEAGVNCKESATRVLCCADTALGLG